ncbi:carbon-nitrogen hydrolase [Cryobacterium glaciale]|uniref:Carbon-nitrogen hydrolase n=1 Tax=Cryobacterium glaciale TaxID=1259145 RepID=A0A4R8UWV9_9MICO|nr:nitrilase-related carbon-nitrogen hydrolase [Cryobacterium glaciale]TFB71852.1 carbon-nitrogen hydrolase [Cryobacterium glaciale]
MTGLQADAAAPADTVVVAAPTVRPRIGWLDDNLREAGWSIRSAVAAGARLIVLPELATSGYVFATPEEARASSIRADDARLRALSRELPDHAVAVVGFAEVAGDQLFSSAAVLSSTGVIATYRKTHLWGDEPRFFTPGDAAPPVVSTPIGRIGVAICYDLEFPEVPRSLALAGADIIVAPVNWPVVSRPSGERTPEIVLAMAAARASSVPIVISDRGDLERGVVFTGGSCVISHEGWMLAGEPRSDHLVMASINLAAGRSKAAGNHNNVFTDRRPDLYPRLLHQ